ncbi:hypothetical protein HDE_06531 [Halotydeus destructor]|nr:hypothetical protein HDE_06531 [Halotydeus destructor]
MDGLAKVAMKSSEVLGQAPRRGSILNLDSFNFGPRRWSNESVSSNDSIDEKLQEILKQDGNGNTGDGHLVKGIDNFTEHWHSVLHLFRSFFVKFESAIATIP